MFTDPFSLFDAVFGMDPHRRHAFRQHHHRSNSWTSEDPFESLDADLDDFFDRRFGGGSIGGFRGGFGPGFGFGPPAIGMRLPSLVTASPFSQGGNWAGESFTSTTVNGVTQTIHKKRIGMEMSMLHAHIPTAGPFALLTV